MRCNGGWRRRSRQNRVRHENYNTQPSATTDGDRPRPTGPLRFPAKTQRTEGTEKKLTKQITTQQKISTKH